MLDRRSSLSREPAVIDAARAIAMIRAAPTRTEPFPHIVCDNFLRSAEYRAICAAILPVDSMMRYEPPHVFRYFYMMDEAGLARADGARVDTWREVARFFRGNALIRVLHEKFAPLIRDQTPHRRRLIEANLGPGGLVETPRLMLTSDCQDFTLQPHTDAAPKVVTLLFYLAHEGDPEGWGTEFYSPKDLSLATFKSNHYSRNDFVLRARADFRPNTLVLFAKTDISFHGVHAEGLTGRRRDMIVLNLEVGSRQDFDVRIAVDPRYFMNEGESYFPTSPVS